MTAQNKKILVFCDDVSQLSRLREILSPVYGKAGYSSQIGDAVFKAQNEVYDAFIVRTTKPSLSDPKGFFQWTRSQKGYARTPCVVVGQDIEDPNIVVTQEHIRFLPTDWKPTQLFDLLDGLFFEDSDAARKMVAAKFVNPIVGAVVDVISTMAQIKLERGTPSLRDPKSPDKTYGDVTGMISVNSDHFSGSLAIIFNEKMILNVYKNMMSEEKTAIDDDIKDCVMEITNIVFGNARRDLNVIGHSIKAARPSVISGAHHEVGHSSQGLCLHLPFSSAEGNLVVELLVTMIPQQKAG